MSKKTETKEPENTPEPKKEEKVNSSEPATIMTSPESDKAPKEKEPQFNPIDLSGINKEIADINKKVDQLLNPKKDDIIPPLTEEPKKKDYQLFDEFDPGL